MSELVRIHPENPQKKKIHHVVEVLKAGGVIIYPTDTVYGLGCDIFNTKAIEQIKRIKGIKGKSVNLSFICHDLSSLSEYARHVDTPIFKMMKKGLPGPFTFILESSSKTPKILKTNKKTVGIRVPNNLIPRMIVQELGNPIVTTSLHDQDEIKDYPTDPEAIYEEYSKVVDLVIDGGPGQVIPSTVIDCTGSEPLVVREGLGKVSELT
ncbi:MAG: L-threonylcarbamoyladenylate synthase [Cyclobacteriaceae bacterium]